ncbi:MULTISPECIES: DUF3251 domain-containing protein [unclassified Rhodanobacter]|uniref:DUF3251 domain-containing protein n=1 Tax=Rhodanobacter humi TaxID=1888173 RepID=A0ABV4ALR4_9GAMM
MHFRSINLALGIVLLSGCGIMSQPAEESANVAKQVTALRSELKSVKEDLTELQAQVAVNHFFTNMDRTARLTPGSSGYSILRTDLGILTVSLDNIEPYANGSKVTLSFGNPLASTINGLKANIEWASMNDKDEMDDKSKHSKAITFNESLKPGSWTATSVVLEGLPPSSLGVINISNASHTGIVLSKR